LDKETLQLHWLQLNLNEPKPEVVDDATAHQNLVAELTIGLHDDRGKVPNLADFYFFEDIDAIGVANPAAITLAVGETQFFEISLWVSGIYRRQPPPVPRQKVVHLQNE
jgi:hypothetical protein